VNPTPLPPHSTTFVGVTAFTTAITVVRIIVHCS